MRMTKRTVKLSLVGAGAVIALTACISVLGLENDKYVSLEDQVCFQYAMLCSDRAEVYGLPRDKISCHNELSMALRKPGSDPSRPNVDAYANNHCRSKTTCADYMDCLAQANFLPSGMCGTSNCIANAGDATVPWRCCPGESCVEIENTSGCFPSTDSWQCLGKVVFPKPDPVDASLLSLALRFVDINNPKMFITDLTVSACGRLDPECMSPVAKVNGSGMDPTLYKVDVPFAFDGFFQAIYTAPTGPDAGPDLDYMPLLVFIVPPITTPSIPMGMGGIPMFRRPAYNFIVNSFGEPADPDAGHIFSFAQDCKQDAAAGATAELDTDAGRLFYFSANQPTLMRTETDPGGQLGFINVPTGLRILTVQIRTVRTSSVVVLVRAGALTFVNLPPTP